jgi:asparaginyl-tRNA synthetase
MVEAEIAFVTSLKTLANEVEFMIKSITEKLLEKGKTDLQVIKVSEPIWLQKDFAYITYDEAIQILTKHSDKLTVPIKYGENLVKEHEFFLVKHYDNTPVFITDWPKHIKAFYMKECDNDSSKVNLKLIKL